MNNILNYSSLVQKFKLTLLLAASVVAGQFRKEGNVLFNDALDTFYLHLYGIRHIVKDH